MTASTKPAAPSDHPAASAAIAWAVTLLVSSLGDILCFELTGAVPPWLLWAKAGLLGALILAAPLWGPLRALRPFFLMLLAITALTRAQAWLLDLPAWAAWQREQPFAVAAITAQLPEIGLALLVISLLFLLQRRRQRFFLVRGDLHAQAEPVRWLGQRSPGPLWKFGAVFTLVVIVAQIFMFILPLSPTAGAVRQLLSLLPVVLLLAAANGFSEEVLFRVGLISPVVDVVGKSNAVWMAAVLFGLAHYIGGIPSGIPGVLITALLGWFFGKCLLDSGGFFWPWLFHAIQDVLPFTLLALSALS